MSVERNVADRFAPPLPHDDQVDSPAGRFDGASVRDARRPRRGHKTGGVTSGTPGPSLGIGSLNTATWPCLDAV
jgi:hypothetical protein